MTLTERLKQYPNPFVKDVLRSINATERNLFGTVPFTLHKDGETINSVATNVTAYWGGRDSSYINGGSSTVTQKTINFKNIYVQYNIAEADIVRDPNIVVNEAISASESIGNAIRNLVYNGTGTDDQMNSMRTETTSGQTISVGAIDPTALSFRTYLNQLVRKVERTDVIIMPVQVLDKYDYMLYNNNGGNTNREMKQDYNASTLSSFNGIPVIGLDLDFPFETVDGTGTEDSTGYCSVYALQLANEDNSKKGCSFVVPSPVTYTGENFGLSISELGWQPNNTVYKNNKAFKVGMYLDFHARNTGSIARLTGVTI